MKYDIEQFNRARLIKGWTYTELARRVGMSVRGVTKLFRGQSVLPSTAEKIAAELGVNLRKALIDGYADIPNPKTKTAAQNLVKSARSYPRKRSA